ncbi:MAG: peptidoglycan DD-metalloendopeptidase family protein [Candidatus Comchoanobacterales bacterium]
MSRLLVLLLIILSQVGYSAEVTAVVRKGDTLKTLLVRHHLPTHDLKYLYPMNHPLLTQLRLGQFVSFSTEGKEITSIKLRDKEQNIYEFEKNNQTYSVSLIKNTLKKTRHTVRFKVQDGVYKDAKKNQLPASLVNDLVKIFSWQVDFKTMHAGDEVFILFEKMIDKSGNTHVGDIIFARINKLNNKQYEAVLHRDPSGKKHYYDTSGYEIGTAFSKKPVKYSRISSPFNPKRKHPVTGKVQPHHGVDLAAPMGTPVYASAAGHISFKGCNGGYGKMVAIKHNEHYITRYAHLSGFAKNIQSGAWVEGQQLIGYVGASGQATGPHLHFEIRKDGKPVDPLKENIPGIKQLTGDEFKRFYANRNHWLALVESVTVV